MIRLLIICLLLCCAVPSFANVLDKITISSGPDIVVTQRPAVDFEQVTASVPSVEASYILPGTEFDECEKITPVSFTPRTTDPVFVLMGAAWSLLVVPLGIRDTIKMDYSGMGFYSWFQPTGETETTTLLVNVTASPGLLNIRMAGTETLKMAGKDGRIVLRVLKPHVTGVFTQISYLTIPVRSWATVTRLP
jgi:hypothetical protein